MRIGYEVFLGSGIVRWFLGLVVVCGFIIFFFGRGIRYYRVRVVSVCSLVLWRYYRDYRIRSRGWLRGFILCRDSYSSWRLVVGDLLFGEVSRLKICFSFFLRVFICFC